MIDTVLLDLDDTILDFRLAEQVALRKTLRHFKMDPNDQILQRYSDINRAQWQLLEKGLLTHDEVNVGRFRLLFEELEVSCSARYATEYYDRQLSLCHYFLDGAEEMLRQLSAEYSLYIVTNGTASVQNRRIRDSGLLRYVSGVFISEEIGADKPSEKFFQHCFQNSPDGSCERSVIIGDSLTSDILGGRCFGLTTIWFNPRYADCSDQIVPDYEIHALSEVAPLLHRLSWPPGAIAFERIPPTDQK